MYVLLLLTTLGYAPPAVAPADAEWRPYAANPKYEVHGRIQGGVFRYFEYRKREPEKNFGVNLPAHQAVLGQADFEVSGTDKSLGHEMAEAASKTLPEKDRAFHERQATAIGQDCPRRPKPAPAPVVVPAAVEMSGVLMIGCVLFAVMFGFFVLAIKFLLIFLLCRWIYRRFVLEQPTV